MKNWIFLVAGYPGNPAAPLVRFSRLGLFVEIVPGICAYPRNVENVVFIRVLYVFQKDPRRNFTRNRPAFHGEISHMR